MEMACAAFCIPTSMTIVLLTAVLDFVSRDNRELHNIAANINTVIVIPRTAKLALISSVYWRKNIKAKVIRAGKANLPNILFTLAAVSG